VLWVSEVAGAQQVPLALGAVALGAVSPGVGCLQGQGQCVHNHSRNSGYRCYGVLWGEAMPCYGTVASGE
jgi:hypothetical protein